jgi:hypothetical protein
LVRRGEEVRRHCAEDWISHEAASPQQEVAVLPSVQVQCRSLVAVRCKEEQNPVVLPLRVRRTEWHISDAPTVTPTCQANELGTKSPSQRSSQHQLSRIWLPKCAAASAGACLQRVIFELLLLTGFSRRRH